MWNLKISIKFSSNFKEQYSDTIKTENLTTAKFQYILICDDQFTAYLVERTYVFKNCVHTSSAKSRWRNWNISHKPAKFFYRFLVLDGGHAVFLGKAAFNGNHC